MAEHRRAPSLGGLPRGLETSQLNTAILRLARVHRLVVAQRLRAIGLHPGQELVMMQLWEHGPQRQTELSRLVGTDAASTTRTVQRLERAGLVRRQVPASDRRVSVVEATAASSALREQVEQIWRDIEERTTGSLTPGEVDEAVALLGELESNLVSDTTNAEPAPAGELDRTH